MSKMVSDLNEEELKGYLMQSGPNMAMHGILNFTSVARGAGAWWLIIATGGEVKSILRYDNEDEARAAEMSMTIVPK